MLVEVEIMKNKKIKEIISLLERFTLKKIDGKRFKKEYMKKWKLIRDKKIYFDDNIHGILDELWCDASNNCVTLSKKTYEDVKEKEKQRNIDDLNKKIHQKNNYLLNFFLKKWRLGERK